MNVSEAFRVEASTVGHSGLDTTFRRVADAIDIGDRALLKEALHVDNKNTRSAFERIVGKKIA